MLFIKNICVATKTIKVLKVITLVKCIVVFFAFVCIVKNTVCCLSE